jgi:hypothetical protein
MHKEKLNRTDLLILTHLCAENITPKISGQIEQKASRFYIREINHRDSSTTISMSLANRFGSSNFAERCDFNRNPPSFQIATAGDSDNM